MKSYSMDIRGKVVEAYHDGEGTCKELAERFKISESSVKKWLRQYREKGHLRPLQTKYGVTPLFSEENKALLLVLFEQAPDAKLEEYQSRLAREHNIHTSISTICRVFQSLELTRKKNASRGRKRSGRREKGA